MEENKQEINQEELNNIKNMNIYEKLFNIGREIPPITKKPKDKKSDFSFSHVTSDMVLDIIKEKMNKYRIIMIPTIKDEKFQYNEKKKNCMYVRIIVEYEIINIDNIQEKIVKEWGGHGSDSGERCIGKANTYTEKYFLLKLFNVATPEDDPDNQTNVKQEKEMQEDIKSDIEEKIEILRIFFYRQAIKAFSKEEKAKITPDSAKKLIDDYCKNITKFKDKEGIILEDLKKQALNGGKRLETTYNIQSKISGFQNAITAYNSKKTAKK